MSNAGFKPSWPNREEASGMSVSKEQIQTCLREYLAMKIDQATSASDGPARDGPLMPEYIVRNCPQYRKNPGEMSSEEWANCIRHNIYRIKDKLSYHIYGPRSEELVDEFLEQFNLEIKKHSFEYYAIMRDVLRMEMQFYSILLDHHV
jgi:hypothetical protein